MEWRNLPNLKLDGCCIYSKQYSNSPFSVAKFAIAKVTLCMFALAAPFSLQVALAQEKKAWQTPMVSLSPSTKDKNFPNNCAIVSMPPWKKCTKREREERGGAKKMRKLVEQIGWPNENEHKENCQG